MNQNHGVFKELRTSLLSWYDRHARILPWREDPTPYRVWVSEMMLQQTRVDTAIPYFEAFIHELPDVEALANATEEKLLKLWQGLGYYSRVRNLGKAAGIVLEEYGGSLPRDPLILKKLPGLGDYASGAIASIAYGTRATAVDGNVLRVIARLTGDEGNIKDPVVKRRITTFVEELLPMERVGDFNQALMELGAMVCLPGGEPLCGECPWQGHCRALSEGKTRSIPKKEKEKEKKSEDLTVFVLHRGGKIALDKRPEGGLLAGLQEFPNHPGHLGLEEAIALVGSWGYGVLEIRALPASRHVFSHRVWNMVGWEIQLLGAGADPKNRTWADPDEIREVHSIPTAYRVYLKHVLSDGRNLDQTRREGIID